MVLGPNRKILNILRCLREGQFFEFGETLHLKDDNETPESICMLNFKI